MEKNDITLTDFYIKKLICVIKSEINNCSKTIYVCGRRSHAFVYILSGSCSYNFDDKYDVTVNTGDILYLAHNADYTMNIHTNQYRFIYCDFELHDNVVRKSNVYSLENASEGENYFIKLEKNYKLYSKSAFSKCISLIYSIYSLILTTGENEDLEEKTEERITKAKEYIDANISDDTLSVSVLADNAEMSEVYFRTLFKKKYNMSPVQYIISARIKKAKQLLKYNFLTLESCAWECGFSTVQYFCRVFKKTTGITPSEYRNNK